MALGYTWRQLIQRLQRHINDGFPEADFSISDNEMLLYVNEALAYALVGTVYQNAKIEGSLVTPDGFLTTYALPALTKDNITKEWHTTLPQTPLSLPLGHSITQAYFADVVNGKGTQLNFIKAKRVAYRKNMPLQFGVRAWVEGSKIIMEASDGSPLLGQTLYVTMIGTRTDDLDAVLNVPDDIIQAVFTAVTARLTQRMQLPKDIIKDDIPAGSKTS